MERTIIVRFAYDNGFGTTFNVVATVLVSYDSAKITEMEFVDCSGPRNAHDAAAIDEKAIELAEDAYEGIEA